jgi:hypothetical protein
MLTWRTGQPELKRHVERYLRTKSVDQSTIMSEFTSTTWYEIVVLGITMLIVLSLIILPWIKHIVSLTFYGLLRYIFYSTWQTPKMLGVQVTPIDVLVASIYLAANITCLVWNTHSAAELSTRSASLLATNTILLLPGTSMAADLLRVSLRSYHRSHYILGTIAFMEGVIHASVELTRKKWTNSKVSIAGLVVRPLCSCCAIR